MNRHKEARRKKRKRQEYNEKYDCRAHRSRKDDIKQGDHVLVRQNKKNKRNCLQHTTQHHMSLQSGKTLVLQLEAKTDM